MHDMRACMFITLNPDSSTVYYRGMVGGIIRTVVRISRNGPDA